MPEIAIIVKAKDEASRVIGGVTGSLGELESAARTAVLPLTAIAVAGGAIIGKMTMTAARTEELGVVIENLGRVSGYGQEELDKVKDSITDLGITQQGAMTIMSRFMGAQLDLADATKITRAAQDLAVIGMEDSSVAAQNLTYAIVAMQPRLLRRYGIYVNLNEIYKKTALALDKETDELTEQEKRQGFLNAILEQAGRFTGTYEAAMGTAGKQIRSFRRYIEELSNELGQYFLPLLSQLVTGASTLMKALIDLPDPVKQIIAAVLGLVTAFAGLLAGSAGLIILIPKVIALGSAILTLATGPIGILIIAVMAIGAAIAALHTAWANNWLGIQDKVRAAIDFMRPLFDAIGAALNWLKDLILPPLRYAFEQTWLFVQQVMATAWEEMQPVIDELKLALEEFWTEMQPRLEEAWAAIQAAMAVVAEWVEVDLMPLLQELWDRTEGVREAVLRLAAAFVRFMGSAFIRGLKLWLKGIINLWDAMASAVQNVIDTIHAFLAMVQRAIAAWRRFTAISGEGAAGPPAGEYVGLQRGLAYVPTTMPATIHRGEAVLTRQQAEVWRNQTMNFNLMGDVYGMGGYTRFVEEAFEKAARYAI